MKKILAVCTALTLLTPAAAIAQHSAGASAQTEMNGSVHKTKKLHKKAHKAEAVKTGEHKAKKHGVKKHTVKKGAQAPSVQ